MKGGTTRRHHHRAYATPLVVVPFERDRHIGVCDYAANDSLLHNSEIGFLQLGEQLVFKLCANRMLSAMHIMLHVHTLHVPSSLSHDQRGCMQHHTIHIHA